MRHLQTTAPSSFAGSGSYPVPSRSAVMPDESERQRRLAALIAHEIIPRLMQLHQEPTFSRSTKAQPPSQCEIERLAKLVIGPDLQKARNYVLRCKQTGFSLHALFMDVLEPAARHLGKLWDEGRCDFLEVTLGVARLQELLEVFDGARRDFTRCNMRRVVTTAIEERSGLAIAEKFLRTSGWHVRSETGAPPESLVAAVRSEWFAIAGLGLGCESRLDDLARTIKSIRDQSCNKAIGIIVGGPVFVKRPELATRIGADAAAMNAPSAVILAQKLFDFGLASGQTSHAA